MKKSNHPLLVCAASVSIAKRHQPDSRHDRIIPIEEVDLNSDHLEGLRQQGGLRKIVNQLGYKGYISVNYWIRSC